MVSFTGISGQKIVRLGRTVILLSLIVFFLLQTVLLGPDGRLRLVDFGSAVLVHPPLVALTASSEVRESREKGESGDDA